MFPVDKMKEPGSSAGGTTWSLNPQAYQNVSNEMVDWAALAQQWIQMKETCPDDVPDAPPPPPLSRSDFHQDLEEQGEAPMEVEKEEEQIHHQASWNTSWNSYRPQQNQWPNLSGSSGWSGWSPPSMVEAPAGGATGYSRGPTEMLAATAGAFRNPPPTISGLNSAQEVPMWPRTHFPSALMPPRDNSELMPGLSVAGKGGDIHVSTCAPKSDVNFVQADTTQTIDAAKRKNLPAWIREGLEKMEREKLRQAEREQEEKQRREEMEKQRQKEEEALKELERLKKEEEDGGSRIPRKSKFESDSESEDDNGDYEQIRRNQRSSKDSGRSRSPEDRTPPIKKTFEELMLDVRRTLTEILLEVTNEEIHEIATETVARAEKKKKPTVNLTTSSILSKSNLPSKLGLAIYGNSDSEGDSETDEDENTQTSDKNEDSDERDSADSDAELQEKIKRQVNAFKKTSREIELQLAEEEEREERKRQEAEEREQRRKLQQACSKLSATATALEAAAKNGGSVGERSRDGETEQLDRNSSRSGRSSRQKKQSRFSDPRDTVRGTLLTHVQILGAYKPDPLSANMIKLKADSEGQQQPVVSERSGSSRGAGATVASTSSSSSSKRSSTRSSRSRRHSDSWSDDDDEASSTSSGSSRRRRRHERSRSSDRHSRHSHSSHGSSRRSRSRSRDGDHRRSSRHSRY